MRLGIAAVAARLDNGSLKVLSAACPNLLREALLYRYSHDPTDRRSETLLDAYNHALAALRYLITKLDAHRLARPPQTEPTPDKPKPRPPWWPDPRNDHLWQSLD